MAIPLLRVQNGRKSTAVIERTAMQKQMKMAHFQGRK
jgi:hypothetical protein